MTLRRLLFDSWWGASAAMLFFLAMLYGHIAVTAYNWRHDEMTRMYVLRHHLSDALRWRP